MLKNEQIMNESRKLFLKQGYKATNVSQIANTCNIAVGSFYKYYKSKEEVFSLIYETEINDIKEKIISKINWEHTFVEIIKTSIEAIKTNFPKNNRILYDAQFALSKDKKAAIDENLHVFDDLFRSRLRSRYSINMTNEKEIDEILDICDFLIKIELEFNDVDKKYKERNLENIFRYIIKALATSRF